MALKRPGRARTEAAALGVAVVHQLRVAGVAHSRARGRCPLHRQPGSVGGDEGEGGGGAVGAENLRQATQT